MPRLPGSAILALTLCLVLHVCLSGCSEPLKPLETALPSEVDGWVRTDAAALDAASAPAIIKQLGLKRAATATYKGPGTVTIRAFEMNVATSAFELIQKWRQQDGLAVYTGPYFVVADGAADPQAARLLEALRKKLE